MSVLKAMLDQYDGDAFTIAEKFDHERTQETVKTIETEWDNGGVIAFGVKTKNLYCAAAELYDSILGIANQGWLRSLKRETALELCNFLRSGLRCFSIIIVPPTPDLSNGISYNIAEDLASEWNAEHPDEEPIT